MTIPSSLATTMYYNIVYEGAAKNLTLAACAPTEWSQRRNVVGVAVPALVSFVGDSSFSNRCSLTRFCGATSKAFYRFHNQTHHPCLCRPQNRIHPLQFSRRFGVARH